MLQEKDIPSGVSAFDGEGPANSSVRDVVANIIGLTKRHYRLIGIFCGVGLLIGSTYLIATPRIYEAKAELLLDRGPRPAVTQQQVMVTDAPYDASFFESQIRLLESERLAREVVQKLQLEQYPEFNSPGGILGALKKVFSRREQSQSHKEDAAVSVLVNHLSAKRVGTTFFVEISFRGSDAALAESIVNALGEAYVADRNNSRAESLRHANDWLKERLDELRRQSATDEQAVNAYTTEKNIVRAGGALVGDQALSALNAELVTARIKTAEAAARLERIETVLRMDNPDASVEATVSDALNSPIITKLRQDYLNYITRVNEYTARYGGRHLAVVALRDKARSTKAAITSELRRLAEGARSDYLISKGRETEIENQRSRLITETRATNSAQVKLRNLEAAAQSSRALYNAFEQKFLELTQEQSLLFDEARLATQASATNVPRAPKVLAISLFGGLLLGLAFAAFREISNRVFRTSVEIEKILRTPCVTVLPASDELNSAAEGPENNAGTPSLELGETPEMGLIRQARGSHYTEALRALKMAVDHTAARIPASVGSVAIGFTSSLPNEGKSTISLSLALLMASVGRRVVLVDGDFRNPSLSRRIAHGDARGLLKVVAGECTLDEGIYVDPTSSLSLLPAVDCENCDSAETLAAPATRKLFEALRERYDYVIVDLPPLLPLTDVQATTSLIDFYFLVVEAEKTHVEVVQHALHRGKVIFDRLAGVVLNKAQTDNLSLYGKYDAYYQYVRGRD